MAGFARSLGLSAQESCSSKLGRFLIGGSADQFAAIARWTVSNRLLRAIAEERRFSVWDALDRLRGLDSA